MANVFACKQDPVRSRNEAIFKHTYDCTYLATIIYAALGAALTAAAGLGAACAEGPAHPPRELDLVIVRLQPIQIPRLYTGQCFVYFRLNL